MIVIVKCMDFHCIHDIYISNYGISSLLRMHLETTLCTYLLRASYFRTIIDGNMIFVNLFFIICFSCFLFFSHYFILLMINISCIGSIHQLFGVVNRKIQ